MTEINSLGDIMRRLPSQHHGRRFLERLIWPSGRVCPHCGGFWSGPIKQGKKGEEGKKGKARPGLYQCRHRECRGQFTVMTCTPMHATKLDLRIWITAIFCILSSSKGISSVALARTLGVNQKTAWRMGHAIRQMMIARTDICGKLNGEVEVDEAFVGGAPKFKVGEPPNKRGRGTNKPMILLAVSRWQGKAKAVLIPQASTAIVEPILAAWISPEAELHTDSNPIYDPIGPRFAAHLKVNHSEREYANQETGASINSAEGYTGNLERAMVGVWHRVRRHHLQTYLAEVCWRWNNRDFRPRRKNLVRGELTAGRTTWKWMAKPVMEQMTALLRGALGRQVRRTPNGGLVWPIWPRVVSGRQAGTAS